MAVTYEITDLMADRGTSSWCSSPDAAEWAAGAHRDPLDRARAVARRGAVLALRRRSRRRRRRAAALRGHDLQGRRRGTAPGRRQDRRDGRRPRPPAHEALLLALGAAIDELGGRYLAAEDVGATPRDMDVIARVTPWVTGLDEALRRLGRPVAGHGDRRARRMRVRDALDGRVAAGPHVVVHGIGHVGAHLAAARCRRRGDAGAIARRPTRRWRAVSAPPVRCPPDARARPRVRRPRAVRARTRDRLESIARLQCRGGLRRGQQPARRTRRRRRARGACDPLRARLRRERRRDHQPRRGARRRRLLAESAPSRGRADRGDDRRRARRAPTPTACRPAGPPSPFARERIAREGKGYWRPEDSTPWRRASAS